MYYCNDFYSLSVLSLYEGELLGVVNKLCFDKKLTKLIQIELLSDEGAIMVLPVKNIYHIGKNAITVKNNLAVKLKVEESNLNACPIGSKAYSIQGEYLGNVKELSFNDKFKTDKISLDNNLILDVNQLATCGKNTVIFYTDSNKINVQKFTPVKSPKIFKTESTVTAEILPTENLTLAEPVEKPKVEIQNNDFLLGRICTKNIVNFNNDVLVKAGTTITKKTLKEVNKFGKLRELMLYCK